MYPWRKADTAWAIALVVSAILLGASLPLGIAATGLLAARWCMKIDREEHAVQPIDQELPELNR